MPCSNCNRSVRNSNGCRVRYCVCGKCNHCHVGGICPDGRHWYLQKDLNCNKIKHRKKYMMCQSHGGHGWIPGCNSGCT